MKASRVLDFEKEKRFETESKNRQLKQEKEALEKRLEEGSLSLEQAVS